MEPLQLLLCNINYVPTVAPSSFAIFEAGAMLVHAKQHSEGVVHLSDSVDRWNASFQLDESSSVQDPDRSLSAPTTASRTFGIL